MRAIVPRLLLIAGSTGLLLQVGCGGCDDDNAIDSGPTIDAREFDAASIDAMDDAGPTTTHSGTISVLDVRVRFVDPTGATINGNGAGHGGQVVASFSQLEGLPGVVDAPGEIFDNRSAATGAGCAAVVWDLATQTPPADEDHGTVSVTGSTATVPPCNFVGDEYRCIGNLVAAVGTGGVLAAGGGAGVLTVVGADFTGSEGMWVSISGAGVDNFRNLGAFPILVVNQLAHGTADNITFYNSGVVTDADIAGATITILAGTGPVPDDGPGGALPDPPEFLADDDQVTVALDAPDADPFIDFTAPDIETGDTFAITQTSDETMLDMPSDGSAFTISVESTPLTHTGTGGSAAFVDTASVTCTISVTGGAFRAARMRSTITIAGSPTGTNDGTFTIVSSNQTSGDTVTYVNPACAAEAFDADTTYTIDDAGNASDPLSVVNIDFNNGGLYKVIMSHTGAGPDFTDNGTDCTIANTGEFMVGLDSEGNTAGIGEMHVVISGSTTGTNDGTYEIIGSDADSITIDKADCVDEAFAAGTSYEVRQSSLYHPTDMPDAATTGATKAGHIFCAGLITSTLTVPAGASDALAQVFADFGVYRVRTTFLRGGLDQITDLNPSNIAVGHAVVGFSNVIVAP
jgi:hypothetical protein